MASTQQREPAAQAAGAQQLEQQARAKHALIYATEKPALKAHLALMLLSVLSLVTNVPTNLNIVVTAALTVYAGSWRSVKPTPPAESMTKSEAMRFPVVGSAVLFGLFLLFKFLPKELVNALLAVYLGGIAVLVLTSATTPYLRDFFPESLRDKELTSPRFKIPYLIDASKEPIHATVPEVVVGVFSLGFFAWYLLKKHWLANNTLGLAFCLEGIEHLSLGSVHVGTILLVGLFFYDIFWVFCTPVMVTVAKNFDAPIKLLFPRLGDLDGGKRPFAMLGLGDIVIPGIFVALILRYDVQNGFRFKYFQSAFVGYVLGLAATIFVMNYFQAAQPALLYIVPSVLACTGLHAVVNGEFNKLWNFSEAKEDQPKQEGQAAEAEADTKKTK
mmetsp:Transcript_25985/g.56637  ORF Transcript_25985/g.56637 Transcript_25985/m.56637 type:complete len:387 (+) Transcript_25985:149-1309(+)|eukprot:CAMPEP_0202892624 /NCGR_PEP_ID=MMETSP1392-20130828/2332_1 /ASSEMBLY_ACC=CAM_ASM_000868 /TAXON_ID=225041 /ORGANISM="Chlamydomonas chlamydogama, Strain SAG 11-48b" /LENGTH=386 /DNA_ID=CAMNT_0049576657 /DNA_START=127 /DNA_END=1287 /DNA_ORIENTATION=-